MKPENEIMDNNIGMTNFLTGIGSIINLNGNLSPIRISDNPNRDNMDAIKKDWKKVGEDIRQSIVTFCNSEHINA
jgi:hypothetical protein